MEFGAYCDMLTTPNGQPTTGDARLAEILGRYRIDSIVDRFIRRAEPELCACAQGRQSPGRGGKVGRCASPGTSPGLQTLLHHLAEGDAWDNRYR
ncbi:hypothetical protein [Streptomyces deccanensis]|uniref:hypothetical protein n=1 Tax=Streptomyces deccanensis TaxID=424188 RepID=UPI0030B85DAF